MWFVLIEEGEGFVDEAEFIHGRVPADGFIVVVEIGGVFVIVDVDHEFAGLFFFF